MDPRTIAYYSQNAQAITARYESVVNGMASYFDRAFAEAKKVLDVGCGSGRDMALLGRLGKDVYGIDATPELIESAQTLHPELKGRVACAAIPNTLIPFGGSFDGVLCSAVLMHVPLGDQHDAVRFIKSCMLPGGHLLYSVPSRRGDVAEESQRDEAGRLFIPDIDGRLKSLFEEEGFIFLDEWHTADSLRRDSVEWATFLMKRGA